MDWEVLPCKGIGPLRFGMSIGQVEEVLGSPARILEKPESSAIGRGRAVFGSDVFANVGRDLICSAYEVAGSIRVRFLDKLLFDLPFPRLLAWFKVQDPDMKPDDTGLISRTFGVAVYAPHYEFEPERPSDAVAVFSKQLYEDHYAKHWASDGA